MVKLWSLDLSRKVNHLIPDCLVGSSVEHIGSVQNHLVHQEHNAYVKQECCLKHNTFFNVKIRALLPIQTWDYIGKPNTPIVTRHSCTSLNVCNHMGRIKIRHNLERTWRVETKTLQCHFKVHLPKMRCTVPDLASTMGLNPP
jgi:hypothetical protein